ncbi:MAG: hypothetical protein WAL02_08745, partial [Rhodoplanes sp.]
MQTEPACLRATHCAAGSQWQINALSESGTDVLYLFCMASPVNNSHTLVKIRNALARFILKALGELL